MLIRGEMLHTVLETTTNEVFQKEFNAIGQYGGWLNDKWIDRLASKVDRTLRGKITLRDSAIKKIARVYDGFHSPEELVKVVGEGLLEAQAMLNSTRETNDNALLIILD